MSTRSVDLPTKRLQSALSALLSAPILFARKDTEAIARSIKSCVEVDEDKLLIAPLPRATVIAQDALASLEKKGWIRDTRSSDGLVLVNGEHNIQLIAGSTPVREVLKDTPLSLHLASDASAKSCWIDQLHHSEQEYADGCARMFSSIREKAPVLLDFTPALDPGLIDREELRLFCTFRDHEAVALVRQYWAQFPHEYC